MTTSYASLVNSFETAVEAYLSAVPSSETPSEIAQVNENLGRAVKLLSEIDVDDPEESTEDAKLSRAVAIAQGVIDRVDGMRATIVIPDEIATDLDTALDAARSAGFVAPDPGNLEWYYDDEPTDGSDH